MTQNVLKHKCEHRANYVDICIFNIFQFNIVPKYQEPCIKFSCFLEQQLRNFIEFIEIKLIKFKFEIASYLFLNYNKIRSSK